MFKLRLSVCLSIITLISLSYAPNSFASQISEARRKAYAQNNIIFYEPCSSGDDCSSSETPEPTPTPDPSTPSIPSDPSTPDTPLSPDDPASPSGALGHTSVSGFYRQFGNNTVWKCPTSSENAKIKNSGCPLVAIANALHAQDSSITLDILISEIVAFHNGCTNRGSLFNSDWSNNGRAIIKWGAEKHNASFSVISSLGIDSTLSNSGAVVVGGNRNSGINCRDNSNVSSGKCLFSEGGHFVTIIGKTKEGKYIITNPANGNLATYDLDLLTSFNHNLNYYAIKL